MRRAWAAFVVAVSLAAPALAYPDPDHAPRYFESECFADYDRRFVFDFLELLDSIEGDQVESSACELYAATGAHVVLVTVPSTDGESLEGYATHLFETWGIGGKTANDGLLVLYAQNTTDGAPGLRIEVGYGLEGTFNSVTSREAYDSMATVKQERLDAGDTDSEATAHTLAAGTSAIAIYLKANDQDGTAPTPAHHISTGWLWVVVPVILLLVLMVMRSRGGLGPGGGMGGGFGRGGWGGWGGGRGGGGWGGGRSGGGGGGGGWGGGRSGGGGWGGRFAPHEQLHQPS